jgi:hypothetical protein
MLSLLVKEKVASAKCPYQSLNSTFDSSSSLMKLSSGRFLASWSDPIVPTSLIPGHGGYIAQPSPLKSCELFLPWVYSPSELNYPSLTWQDMSEGCPSWSYLQWQLDGSSLRVSTFVFNADAARNTNYHPLSCRICPHSVPQLEYYLVLGYCGLLDSH